METSQRIRERQHRHDFAAMHRDRMPGQHAGGFHRNYPARRQQQINDLFHDGIFTVRARNGKR